MDINKINIVIVMSTLPCLFHKRQNVAMNPQGKMLRKEGGIYSLNLTISFEPSRTKILQPPNHRTLKDKKQTDFIRSTSQKTRYKSRHSRSFSLSTDYKHSTITEQFDSVRASIKKVTQLAYFLSKDLQKLPSQNLKFHKQLKQLQARASYMIETTEQTYQSKIEHLWATLTECRKQTGMDVKVCKKQLEHLQQAVRDNRWIIQDIERHRNVIKSINF